MTATLSGEHVKDSWIEVRMLCMTNLRNITLWNRCAVAAEPLVKKKDIKSTRA